ncbi:MAG: ECF transporter S component, partial [Clostridia bacterium]|nr:ECF transporter S component [Clostridia bacterium]
LYGFLAAGIGSAIADVFSGYAVYAPATLLIKGLMALSAFYIHRILCKRINSPISRLISGLIAELIMVLGYYVFEGFMYGFTASLVNVPANAVQGAAGLILGFVLVKILEKTKITFN